MDKCCNRLGEAASGHMHILYIDNSRCPSAFPVEVPKCHKFVADLMKCLQVATRCLHRYEARVPIKAQSVSVRSHAFTGRGDRCGRHKGIRCLFIFYRGCIAEFVDVLLVVPISHVWVSERHCILRCFSVPYSPGFVSIKAYNPRCPQSEREKDKWRQLRKTTQWRNTYGS